MKILFIYPEFPDTFWSFKHALKFIQKKAGAPPLGLLTVAAMLPAEWEKRLVDLNVTNIRDEDLAWADYVFISAMVVQRESARIVIQRCKTAGVKMVAGGPLFTMEHEKFPDVNHFVLNEAELTLPPFLAMFGNSTSNRRPKATTCLSSPTAAPSNGIPDRSSSKENAWAAYGDFGM